ncbi:hypothetical protein L3X38_011771 [Prunus dulcis]|uniref:Uncharacterized protein n=1 Tax=Prunus dulcis TaxID=3755 RepID=A0AAD4WI20_PRUDU|nr:hypothetical protein L3X38_011771 [Prunus dulcis]
MFNLAIPHSLNLFSPLFVCQRDPNRHIFPFPLPSPSSTAPVSQSSSRHSPSPAVPQPARFCFWELTKQLPRVVTHPGIAPASHSLNFGVLTTPKPVSSQKASRYEDARVVTHPGIAPASNSLNFGVPTNPKPVSSQKASRYEDVRHITPSPFGRCGKPVSSQKASCYKDARCAI